MLSVQPTDSLSVSDNIERLEYAAERARLLMGAYRKGEAQDPDTYVTAIGAVLADFDEEVIRRVTDPVRGLPRKIGWLPQIKEVAEECERIARVVKGERLIAERETAGFRWIDDRANSRLGFYNDRGDKYGEPLCIERRVKG